jgi:hypothetical protein
LEQHVTFTRVTKEDLQEKVAPGLRLDEDMEIKEREKQV